MFVVEIFSRAGKAAFGATPNDERVDVAPMELFDSNSPPVYKHFAPTELSNNRRSIVTLPLFC